MHRTIEALYKDGRIISLEDMIPVREARVLITFLEEKKMAVAVRKNKSPKLKTYHCDGKIRDFTREDAYVAGI
jgi:hypothetical protein